MPPPKRKREPDDTRPAPPMYAQTASDTTQVAALPPDDAATELGDEPAARGQTERDIPDLSPAFPLPPIEKMEQNQWFGRFRLLRRLAAGGMGEVYLARQEGVGGFEKLLVIKRLLPHLRGDSVQVDMFFDEARLQAVMNDRNIAQIFDMGEVEGEYYIAMEYVHGVSWRRLIDRLVATGETLHVAHVVMLAVQVARGLAYAHSVVDGNGRPLQIVHRDINPHNLLISFEGECKIIDFGIAKSQMSMVHTETGTIKGKFAYMSPEQVAAEPLDMRSDVFSLGICMYELLTGENPFRRDNLIVCLDAIVREQPPRLATRRADAAPIADLVERCLEKSVAQRFPDCLALVETLTHRHMQGAFGTPEESLPALLQRLFAAEIAHHQQLLEQSGSAAISVRAPGSRLGATGFDEVSHAAPRPPRTPEPTHLAPRLTSDHTTEVVSGDASYIAARTRPVAAALSPVPTAAAPPEIAPPEVSRSEASQPHARVSRWPVAFGVFAGAAVGLALLASVVLRLEETEAPLAKPLAWPAPPAEPPLPASTPQATGAATEGPDGTQDTPSVSRSTEPPAGASGPAAGLAQVDGDGDVPSTANTASSRARWPRAGRSAPSRRAKASSSGKPPTARSVVPRGSPAAVETPMQTAPVAERTAERSAERSAPLRVGELSINAGGPYSIVAGAVRGTNTQRIPIFETGSQRIAIGGGQAPLQVSLQVTRRGAGLDLTVDSEPWSIVRVNQLGKGKTPVRRLELAAGERAQLQLSSPQAEAPMQITLRFQPAP